MTHEIRRDGNLRVMVKWPCGHQVTDKFCTPQAAALAFEIAIAHPPTCPRGCKNEKDNEESETPNSRTAALPLTENGVRNTK